MFILIWPDLALSLAKICAKLFFLFTDDVWPMISAQVDWIVDPLPPPASSSLLSAVSLRNIVNNTSDDSLELYHHKKVTYLGYRREHCIYKVDKNGVSSELVTLPDGEQFLRMTIFNDKLYVLTCDDWVLVYSLRGEQITSWQIKSGSSCSGIVTAGDKLVVDCTPELLVFDEEGNKLSTLSDVITCNTSDRILSLDSKSIIVVNSDCDYVKRIDIRTGEELWSNKSDISRYTSDIPVSAVYDGHSNILVLDESVDIHVLDVSTG